MASVDGSRSLQGASDELYDHECGPCGNEGKVKEAKQHCSVCSEFLCDTCVKHHRNLPITKNHNIVPAHTVSVSSSRRMILYCGCKNNREPEYHCENHDDVICSPCKDIKHHKFKTVPIQQKCSSYKSSQIDGILKKSKCLKNKHNRLKQKCASNKIELGRSKDICQNEIKAFRKELNDFLDRLEQKMLKELSDIEDEKRKKLDAQIATLTNALQLLDADHKILAEAKVDGRNHVMYTAEIQTSKTTRDCESRLAELEKDITELILSFKKNKKLQDLQADVKSFGAINKIEKKDGKGVLLGKHVQSCREVNVRLADDGDNKPWITGCAVMPNSSTVICDRGNSRLSLFDKSWSYQGSLSVPDIWDVSVVDTNTVIVTVPEQKKLQYVQVLPQLQHGRAIQLDYECWGVCVSGDDIYLACETPDIQSEIRVLGLDGTEKRHVPLDSDCHPYDITLSPSGEKIHFTDCNIDIVTCMTVDGRIVYKYEDDNMQNAKNIYCDSEDNLLVCALDSNIVQVITADGDNGGSLLGSSNGLNGSECIAYRCSDNELIIACSNLDHLLVYKMRN